MIKNKHRAVVTGLGVVAPNGNNKDLFCNAIFNGETGLGAVELFDMSEFRTRFAGEVKLSMPGLKKPNDLERTILLAVKALDEALKDSKLNSEYVSSLENRAGLSFATSLGGNLRMMEHIKQELNNETPAPEWVADMNFYTNFIARHAGVYGPCFTTTPACAAGTAASGLALDLIRNGRADLVILGGCDPLTEFSVGGFHSLKSMSPSGCRPFDNSRDGMLIGEGSAMLVVEELEHALKRGAYIYGEILGYGISNDAYHITSPDPNGGGAIRAMRMALETAGVGPEQIDYINAHGTATPLNDKMEINAISQVFGENAKKITISSTKSMTGHCLGAAGMIELAASILALDKGFIPPTATLEKPDEDFEGFNLLKGKGIKADLKVVMSNSFAFAGNAASVIIGKYEGGYDARG